MVVSLCRCHTNTPQHHRIQLHGQKCAVGVGIGSSVLLMLQHTFARTFEHVPMWLKTMYTVYTCLNSSCAFRCLSPMRNVCIFSKQKSWRFFLLLLSSLISLFVFALYDLFSAFDSLLRRHKRAFEHRALDFFFSFLHLPQPNGFCVYLCLVCSFHIHRRCTHSAQDVMLVAVVFFYVFVFFFTVSFSSEDAPCISHSDAEAQGRRRSERKREMQKCTKWEKHGEEAIADLDS